MDYTHRVKRIPSRSVLGPALALAFAPLPLAVACGGGNEATPPPVLPAATATANAATTATAEPVASGPLDTKRLPRAEFNRLAMLVNQPLFWTSDANGNGALDPNELAVFWGLVPDTKAGAKLGDWVSGGNFTSAFRTTYEAMVHRSESGPKTEKMGSPSEILRLAAVEKELSQGRQTLVATDLSKATEEQKNIVKHVLRAAEIIERLYAMQAGNTEVRRFDDPASKSLFFRNQSPKCAAPLTQNDTNCRTSVEPINKKLSGLYSESIMKQDHFCEALGKLADKQIMDPFTVVRGDAMAPKAVPYTTEYAKDMSAVSAELAAAANEIKSPAEAALKAYLLAASKAFTDNAWVPADEAWAKMGVDNSKFYLRIAPDEVYSEPCSTKALFHVSFGLINQASLKWQQKLDPRKTDMEKALATLAGAPYKARAVSFKLPDFVDIAVNAGDSRPAFGATIGQSLPNFGPVANEGRGRTVAMTNFYTDPDSLAATKATAESMFCAATMKDFTLDPEPQLMSTVLHEAAHNLGPAHQYKVDGKTDREVFGGPLASTFEELKAQTAAMFYAEWLVEKKDIERAYADKAHIRDVFWGFGHISRGMYDEDHHPKNYSQLAAIQFGSFLADGAITWNATEKAANGADVGCYTVNLGKLPASVKKLMKVVAGIKGRGDKKGAEKLVADFVDVQGDKKAHLDRIRERVLRAPKPSFVYSVKFD